MKPWSAILLLTLVADLAAAQPASPAPRGPEILVSLERGTCERRCPAYSVTLHGDGRVVYQGRHWVRKTGTARARVNPAAVRRLVEQFEAADFFALKDVYGDPGDCTERREDAPRSQLSLTVGGRSKTVRHNVGCVGPVTSRLTGLADAVDRLADTGRWTQRPRTN